MGWFSRSKSTTNSTNNYDSSTKAAQDEGLATGGHGARDGAIAAGGSVTINQSDEEAIKESMQLSRYALEQNSALAADVLNAFGTVAAANAGNAQQAVDAATAQAAASAGEKMPAWLMPLTAFGLVGLVLFVRR